MDEIKQMLTLVLEKVDSIDKGLEEVKQRLDRVEERLDRVEERLDRVEERLDRVEERLGRVEKRLDAVEKRLDAVEQRLDAVEQRLDTLEKRVDKLEVETTKNSVMLEELKRKLELMAEIQQSHFDQDKREHEELRRYVDGRFAVIEFAIKQLSSDMEEMKKDIKELKENRVKIEVFYEILGRHEVEISNLKKAVFSAN
jgi:chromosome segregation ATPase